MRFWDRKCIACGSLQTGEFLDLGEVPVQTALSSTYREAKLAAAGHLRLAFCRECGHIFNPVFDPELVRYTPEYDNSLDFSPKFQQYARELAEGLIARCGLRGKDIVEVGCGHGDFLRLLCHTGGNCGTGFDPAAPFAGSDESLPITWIREYYSDDNAVPADFVYSRHTLEHIPEPRAFVSMLRRAIGATAGSQIFLEVPNVMSTLADCAIWDLIYPHVSYFSRHSLTRLLGDCGFTTRNAWSAFDNQFLCVEAVPGPAGAPQDAAELAAVAAAVAEFAKVHRETVATWSAFLQGLAAKEQRAMVWGAGAKAVTFLTSVPGAETIKYVVDLNQRKHGRYIPKGGQLIVAPEFVSGYRPDVTIVMNPCYEGEIRQMLRDRNVVTEIVSLGGQVVPAPSGATA